APEPPWILLTGYGESAVAIARRPQGSPLILAGKREGLVERLGEGGDLWNGAADDFSAPLLRLTFMIEGRTWRVRAGEAEALLSRVSGPAPEWLWLVVPPGAVLRRITVEGAPDGSWLDARRELLSRDGGGGG
ncbi:MAG: hypothetical protein ACE5GW_01400, partial [Planctomycetota bacterium]